MLVEGVGEIGERHPGVLDEDQRDRRVERRLRQPLGDHCNRATTHRIGHESVPVSAEPRDGDEEAPGDTSRESEVDRA